MRLISTIIQEVIEISQEYSKNVFDDAIDSVENTDHACHHFYRWQKEHGYTPFQLPEPFSGREALLGIAFIGLNPGCTHDEIIPCYTENITFEQYDSYFRKRFDEENRDDEGKLTIRYETGATKNLSYGIQ